MREMKDSGIEWVGSIPSHWDVMANKYIMSKLKVIKPSYRGEDILSLTMNGVIVRDLDAGGKMPSSFNGYQTLFPGNLLMCLFDYDVTPRCIGLIKNHGVTSPAYSQFFLLNDNHAPYYYYYYLMIDHTKELLHLAKNLRHSFTEDQLGAISTPVPPVDEQHRIADFLDETCAEIDALTADVQKEIGTLQEYRRSLITEAVTKGLDPDVEMKDSGIPWIGCIPITWKVRAIGYGFEVGSGSTPSSTNVDFWDGDVPWVTPADFKTEDKTVFEGRRFITQMGYSSCGTRLVKEGSIIFSKRAPIGSVVIAGQKLCTNQGCFWCTPKTTDVDSVFFYYNMSVYPEIFNLFGSGTTFKEISADTFKNIKLSLPSYDEQRRIADYLDKKCAEIDSIIETKQKQLETLAEYRKSLIYEYVTGKKEVV